MPQTLEALLVVAIAVVPGAAYRLAFEAVVGPWGTTLPDRIVRFVVYSAILHAVFAAPTYWLWSTVAGAGILTDAEASVSAWLALAPPAYALIPALLGLVHGELAKRGRSLLPDPHPTGREYLFGYERRGWVRLRLLDGTWLAGFYGLSETTGLKGYASSYGEADGDLLLSETVEVDPQTGQWQVDDEDMLAVAPRAVLVPWRQVERLEFEPAEEAPDG